MSERGNPLAGARRFEEMIDLGKVLNAVFPIAIIAEVMISINMMARPFHAGSLSVLILLLTSLILYYLYSQGYKRGAGFGLIIAVSIAVTYNFISGAGIHDNAIVIFPVLIIGSGLILGRRSIPYLTGVILVEVTVIQILSARGLIEPYGGVIEISFLSFLVEVALLVISGYVVWSILDSMDRRYLDLIAEDQRLRDSYDQVVSAWGNALELFDRAPAGANQRAADLAVGLARRAGLTEGELVHVHWGALLHDIGKMGISEEILNKKESLTASEKSQIEKHPLHAHVLLKGIPYLAKAVDIPVYHHEQWDGKGYPYHLSGEDIPLSARIFAIVDNWDALTADRPYRKAWPEDKVIQYLRNQQGKKFDPELVRIFLDYLAEFR